MCPEPKKVLPTLAAHLERGIQADISATVLLRVVGPDAIEPLVKALRSPKPEVRAAAAWTLAECHPGRDGRLVLTLNGQERTWENFPSAAHRVSPALVKALNDSDATVRHRAAYALGKLGGDAKTVVPALLRVMTDTNALVRQHAAGALGRFGDKTEPVVQALRKAQLDPLPFVRQTATESLKRLGLAPRSSVEPMRPPAPIPRRQAPRL